MPEAKAQHHFIKSVERNGEWVAMVADALVLEKNNISIDSIRSASRMNTFNAIQMREGMHFMTEDQLQERITVFKAHGMDKSVENMQRALDVVSEKNAKPSARAPLPQAHAFSG